MSDFPQLPAEKLFELRVFLDGAFKEFSRSYGEQIEGIFSPLLYFLVWFELILLNTPWWIVIIGANCIVWWVTRSWKPIVMVTAVLCLIGLLGMWPDTMRTLSMITVCTLIAVFFGLPIGIVMAYSRRAEKLITPILDIMQTMPAFVYLIPVVMLLGIGKVPGVIAVVIYAMPPLIRLTTLGIKTVDHEVTEAADSFGASTFQKLIGVQLPLALPSIMSGINQTIMMALAMVVIASMIGVKGLGQPVLRAITNQYFTLGILNGFAIVALAIIFDRVSQAYGQRLHKKS